MPGSRTCRALAGAFGLGLAPAMPGTVGALAGIPLAWGLSRLPSGLRLAALLLLLPGVAAVCGRAAGDEGTKDPSWIVLDEMVGFCYAVAFVRPGISAYVAGFFLFRVFDILKPPPAGWIDRCVPGGAGILLDDVVAGLYARLLLWLLGGFGVG